MEFLYEKRIGPVGMFEIAVPVKTYEATKDTRNTGVGDIALGYKHTLLHNLESGDIFSVGGEIILPTGNENKGLGKGTTVIEPFLTYGKILPKDFFFQAHTFAEFPTDSEFENEVGFRATLGKTFTSGNGFGRAWSPMIEVLSIRDLESEAKTKLDIVPQLQISLNTRQHILFNIGAKIPVTETTGRHVQIVAYILWDWFDGGFFDGW